MLYQSSNALPIDMLSRRNKGCAMLSVLGVRSDLVEVVA